MPDPIRQALQASKTRVPDTSKRERPVEPTWNAYSVLAYDGLMPTQIVRRITEQDGVDSWEATYLPFRMDGRPDSDDRRNDEKPFLPDDPERYVDERRYVVDPMEGKHVFRGLWTGGPVRMTTDKRTGVREVTQVLTRTFCAGHGYTTDEHGWYVCAYTNDGGTTFHDKDGNDIPADKVREYLSADDALRYHRPALGSRLSPYMINREDIPASYTREVQWREFTHESIQFLDPLGLIPGNRPRLAQIVTDRFYWLAGEAVTNAACRVDYETNTVIFTAALTYTKLGEPSDPSELLALPCLETCDRDTLRMFGWGQLEDGEGYKYTHVFKWPRLKDTPEVRRALEFIKDNAPTHDVYAETDDGSDSDSDADRVLVVPAAPSFVVALLRQHGLMPAAGDATPAWFGDGGGSDSDADDLGPYEKRFSVDRNTDQLDHTGRLVTSVTVRGDADGSDSDEDVPVQTYRIAKQGFAPDQDGSVSFVVALVKTEWHGGDDGRDWEDKQDGKHGSRVLAGVSAPEGYGITEHRVVVSVPRENAIPTMAGIKAKDGYELVTEKRQTEGQEGASDISFQKRKLYNFVDQDHTPSNIVNVDNNPFNATSYNYDPNTNTYNLGWTYVAPEGLQDLVDSVRKKLGGTPIVRTEWHPEGYYSVRIVAKGKEPRHVREWMVSANWYEHHTLEQWIGVTIKTDGSDSDSDDGDFLGFYTRYERNADGSYKIDNAGNLIPIEASFVPFREIRGDLDANWMGSDPQTTRMVTIPDGAPSMFVTTGMDQGGDGSAGDGKALLTGDSRPSHDDYHANGWTGGDWSDPDAGNQADKKRLHVITTVEPRRNQDGSYDVAIRRTYPHQRYWEWHTEQENSDGDRRKIKHYSYRNWPSRKAIEQDIIERIKQDIGGDGSETDEWDDGWTLGGGIEVNRFGLVDAPNMALAPAWDNDKNGHIKSKKGTEYYEFVIPTVEKADTPPAQFKKDPESPADGYWWRLVTKTVQIGTTWVKDRADIAVRHACEGSRGVEEIPSDGHTMKHWKWHVVTNISIGEWQKTSLMGVNLQGSVTHHIGPPPNNN